MRFLGRLLITILSISAACAAPVSAFAQSGVDVVIDQFGLGMFRSGGIVPMRVQLTSNLAEPTPVWVQWQVPNADGDVGEYGRSLTLSPGQSVFTWLYAPIQPNDGLSSVWTVRVFEERDGERRGEIGGIRFAPGDAQAQQADLAAGMIAVVGDRRMSLDDYAAQSNFRIPRPLSGHEDTRIISALKPAQLPDRWFGLMAFEAIAWAGDNTPPQDLTIDQADAIREYVQRGGHLVISLPAAGNPWGLGAIGQTQLEDILPCRVSGAVPRRDEGVKLADLLPVLSKTRDVRRVGVRRGEPPEFSIRVFKDLQGAQPSASTNDSRQPTADSPFNVIDNGYEPLLALADGRVIAVQKRVGFGRVTVIGIDLSDGRLAGLGLPHADAFWNRVLGRRVDTPTLTELQEAERAETLGRPIHDNDRHLGSGMLFSGRINMQTEAGLGLMLSFLLFVAYWLVAAGSFFMLRRMKMARHAWVAFAGVAGVFTFIAWASVGIIPKSRDVQHITVLDHIARPPETAGGTGTEEQFQRALSFFSVYLPRYGTTEVKIDSMPDQRDLLTSWTPPGESVTPFPNTDVFRIDVARGMAALNLPSRSTTTQLQANWLGGVDPKWGGLLRVDPANPLRVVKNAGGNEQALAGNVISELPGQLKDAVVIWVRNNRYGNRRYQLSTANGQEVEREWIVRSDSGSMTNTGEMWAFTAPWDAGASKDFSALGPGSPLSTSISARYVQPYENTSNFATTDDQGVRPEDQRRFMIMLSMFHQLTPPEYLRTAGDRSDNASVATFHREMARELDLSAWFTRPCVIVVGFLEDVPTPIPLRIDGGDETPSSTGLVMVRWIYPLPLDESVAFRIGSADEQ